MATGYESQLIHWISGKGGVGKSTVAASQALSLARAGYKTLLVELGDKSFFRLIFNVDVEFAPKNIEKNLSVALWSGEGCLKEYLLHFLKVERIVQMFFDNRVMKSLLQAAPGLRELALAGKITSGIRGIGPELNFDRVVVDGFATGHFRALLDSPQAMAEAVSIGPMGEQSRSIAACLKSSQCRYFVAVVPEELPVTEGMELADYLRAGFSAKPEIVMNRWLVPPVNREEILRLPKSDFTAYLAFLLERQDGLEAEILRHYRSIKRIPVSWEISSRDRIERLAQLWAPEWK